MRSNRWWRGVGTVVAGACIALGAGHGVAAADAEPSAADAGAATSQASGSTKEPKSIVAQGDSKPTSTVSAGRPTKTAASSKAAKRSAARAARRDAVKARSKTVSAKPSTGVDPVVAAIPGAEAPTAPAKPKPLNVVGSLLFNVLTLPLKLLQHPTPIPPGYSITTGRSTLDLGGKNVDARWYFPDADAHEGAAPQSIVYLQHGFLRTNSAMAAMAMELAQRTDSVVVTPTVTSNFFAADGRWINGVPTQRAVANLFEGDRTALTGSAVAAGWTGGVLPTKFVLAGHSAGGGLAAAAAGYTVDNGTASDLLLVVMLDAVPTGDALPTALGKLTGSNAKQVLLMASRPYVWNYYGLATRQLEMARPGQFIGVQMVGGSHVDYEGASTDFVESLVCGFSRPENVKAVQDLAVEWINDAIAGDAVVAPGGVGDTVTIPTVAGDAKAVVLGVGSASILDRRELVA